MNDTAATAPEAEFIPANAIDPIKEEAMLLVAAVRLLKRHPVALLAAAAVVTLALVLKRPR